MNKRLFNKFCRIHFGKRTKKEVPLTDEEKHSLLLFIIKNKGPVHKSLITEYFDEKCSEWARCCGYLYQTGDFLHTCENTIVTEKKFI